MMVSVALFSLAMVMALGALLALSSADRRAESLNAAINNLNFAVDSMSRDIRTGYNWSCNLTIPSTDCKTTPTTAFTYTSDAGVQIRYQFDSNPADCGQTGATGGCIERSVYNPLSSTWSAWATITEPEVVITGLDFYAIGTPIGSADNIQPKLTVLVSGYVQVSATQNTSFDLQTSVTERAYDE